VIAWFGWDQFSLKRWSRHELKHLVALVMIAFFMVPAAAMAKDNPCKQDKAKFCKEVKASGGKVGACLRQHMNEVSDECKARLNTPKGAADAEKATKKAEPEGAAPDADSSAGPSESE
jgi:Cysteine rich repeat